MFVDTAMWEKFLNQLREVVKDEATKQAVIRDAVNPTPENRSEALAAIASYLDRKSLPLAN